MSERDKKLLFYLAAMLILAIPYFFIVRPHLDKIDALDGMKMQLNSELAQKQTAYAKQKDYKEKMAEMDQEIESIMSRFPEDNAEEKSIMFAYDAENNIPMNFSQLSFAENAEMLIDENADPSVDTTESDVEAIANPEESEPEVLLPDAPPQMSLSQLTGKRSDMGMTFTVGYQGYKDFMAYIRDYDDRLVITGIDVGYDDSTGLVSGNLVLSQYALLGPDRVLDVPETGVEDKLGSKNIFKRDGSSDSILDLIDILKSRLGESERSKEAEKITPDYIVRVDASTGNTNAITIGRAKDDNEGISYLTSNNNYKENVYFSVSGSDGSYKAKYNISGKEYEDDTFTKAADEKLCLEIQSTYRINDVDNVSADVHVTNESDKELVVIVSGDDPNTARIEIVEKNGNIVFK